MSAEMKVCECGCGRLAPIAKQTDKSRGFKKGEPIRFIKGHNARFWMARPAADRFWEKVAKGDGCWLWIAGTNRQGYGRFAAAHSKTGMAHRYAYELANGPIPNGMVVDHLCRVKACVRPSHLEAVTPTENTRRGHRAVVTNRCKRDHEFTAENTRIRRDGTRACRACERIRREESYVR